MLVKMMEVLVKITVMMMAPGSVPAPPGARGREPPFLFFFLNLLPGWDKGFPSGPWLQYRGRGESPSEIGSISLSLSVSTLSDPVPSPFLLYPEIRNSDWGESFTQIFLIKLAFFRQKKSVNRLTGGPRGCQARPGGRARPLSRVHLRHRFTLILPPENPKYSKIFLRPFLSRLDSV